MHQDVRDLLEDSHMLEIEHLLLVAPLQCGVVASVQSTAYFSGIDRWMTHGMLS